MIPIRWIEDAIQRFFDGETTEPELADELCALGDSVAAAGALAEFEAKRARRPPSCS